MRPLLLSLAALSLVATARADSHGLPGGAARTEPTVITSQTLNVDYLHNVGTFEGNVLVIDPQITVRSDRMIVYFTAATSADQTNLTNRTLKKIEAHGGVVITSEDKKATSENAEYTALDGKVVLTGHPQVEGPDGVVNGDKITFWRDDQKMDVESGTRLILYPDEIKRKQAASKTNETNAAESNSPPAEVPPPLPQPPQD